MNPLTLSYIPGEAVIDNDPPPPPAPGLNVFFLLALKTNCVEMCTTQHPSYTGFHAYVSLGEKCTKEYVYSVHLERRR